MKRSVFVLLLCCIVISACAGRKAPVDYEGQRERSKESHRELEKE